MTTRHLISDAQRSRLGALFRRVATEFPYYCQQFSHITATPNYSPEYILTELPALDTTGFRSLQSDVFRRLGATHFLNDTTSGTTGPPKLRLTSPRDERAEEDVCVRFFQKCGVVSKERIFAIDIGAVDIYLFLGRALRRLGVIEFSFLTLPYCDRDVRTLATAVLTAGVTTLITIPSVLGRLSPTLEVLLKANLGNLALRRIVAIGESMSKELRFLLDRVGIETFSLFGTTETGWIGGECTAHRGVHLFSDVVVPTLRNVTETPTSVEGDALWTTLHLWDQPLIKFDSRDHVIIDKRPCPCGDNSPLMTDIRRAQDEIVLYGYKIPYAVLYETAVAHLGPLSFLQVLVHHTNGRYELTFRFPSRLRRKAARCRDVLLATGELGDFVTRGLATMRLEFTPPPPIRRKQERVIHLDKQRTREATLSRDERDRATTQAGTEASI